MAARLPKPATVFESAAHGMASILDDYRATLVRNLVEQRHVARLAGVIDGDYSLHVRTPRLLKRRGAKIV